MAQTCRRATCLAMGKLYHQAQATWPCFPEERLFFLLGLPPGFSLYTLICTSQVTSGLFSGAALGMQEDSRSRIQIRAVVQTMTCGEEQIETTSTVK